MLMPKYLRSRGSRTSSRESAEVMKTPIPRLMKKEGVEYCGSPGEDVNAGQSHWDQADVILADTVPKHLVVNGVGSQLFVGHSASEDVASVESRLRDCLVKLDRSSVVRGGDVSVIEFEGEVRVGRHRTSRQGDQEQTDEIQVELAPYLDLYDSHC
jgi:hypothetical protein